MDKRLLWFDEGASMLRLVLGRLGLGDKLPAAVDYYACPCCLVGYTREAVTAKILTEEHVPPDGLGGHGLLLTCARCNHSSGTYFDSHAVRRADVHDFVRSKVTGRTLQVTLHADGIPLRGTAQWTAKGVQIFGVPKQNDPRIQAAHFKALDAYVESGNPAPNLSFTVHPRFDEARARLSWIRAAYLAAFAALGWSYILRPVMDPVRDQLKNPNDRILSTYIFHNANASPDERRVLLVDSPDELRCVAVVMGEHTVFLPGLWRPMTWEALAEAFARRRAAGDQLSVNLDGNEAPWPTKPTYLLDRPVEEAADT